MKLSFKGNLNECSKREINCNAVLSINADVLAGFYFGRPNTSHIFLKAFSKMFFVKD